MLGSTDHGMKWRTKSKVAIGVVAAAILGVAAYTSLRDISFHQRPFDSSVWQRGGLRVRGEMVDSLRDRALLTSRTPDEVIAVLGKPDEDHNGQLRYRVDVGRRIGWQPFFVTLVVNLDDKGRVYQVVTVD
jgi:hypothetical protein